MIIKNVQLINFRNHTDFILKCEDETTLIIGKNGYGKTSVLEAIYILTRGKSFRASDKDIIKRGSPFYRIKLEFADGKTTTAAYDNKTKTFTIGEQKSRRLPAKNKYPVVLFLPSDLNLISSSPSRRRDYFDRIFSDFSDNYHIALLKYNKAIKQRNELLKNAPVSQDTVFSWNLILAKYGVELSNFRSSYISEINDSFSELYYSISGHRDDIVINYKSDLAKITVEKYLHSLEHSLARDLALGHTSYGVHHDDYVFMFNGEIADGSASRGESRSMILALKFIEASLIEQKLNLKPIILLDDVFSELDENHRECLVKNFKDHQIIITSVWYNHRVIKIEKIIPGGQALGTMPDGCKIFFWNALPGEIVKEYEITKKKSRFVEAIAKDYEQTSKYRIPPKDTCFLSTSPWQIIDWEYENRLKKELVKEIFREHQINVDPSATITDGKPYFYRNKMEYSLYWDNSTSAIELAFHNRGSHRKIPIKSSSIERPEIFAVAKNIIYELNAKHEEARKYQSLVLRCNQEGAVSGGLYENNKPHPRFKNLTDSILGKIYSYSPNGFFQINLPVYELALKEIKKHINTENVLDLYAGVGTIGLSVAPDHHLTLVECDKYAFQEMAKNITIKDISRPTGSELAMSPVTTGWLPDVPKRWPRAILAKSENVTNYIEVNQTVILDPPRAGCDKKLISKLLEIGPEVIIYLSCNPATQARDIKFLLKKYSISEVKIFNFFPRTPHIENLVILKKSC